MNWIWDLSTIDEGRFQNAKRLKPVSIDDQKETGVFKGSTGSHNCTLSHCDCPDFSFKLKGKQPCKHILALGIALGAYDSIEVQRFFDGKEAIERLSMAYGRYYLFRDPIMTNDEYDDLKKKWKHLIPTLDNSTTHDIDTKDESEEIDVEAYNNRKMGDDHFQITKEIGILSKSNGGWTKEVNLISWNGETPKLDIRTWSPDRSKMSKGITLSEQEADKLLSMLEELRKH